MQHHETPREKLATLLGRLEDRAKAGHSRLSVIARRLSGDPSRMMFAAESGVVAVALSSIHSLSPVPGLSPDHVRLDLRDGDCVSQMPDATGETCRLLGTPGNKAFVWPRGSEVGEGEQYAMKMGTSICEDGGIDTTTTCGGGVADQTDDHRSYCRAGTD